MIDKGKSFWFDYPREQIIPKTLQMKRNQFLRLFLFLNAK